MSNKFLYFTATAAILAPSGHGAEISDRIPSIVPISEAAPDIDGRINAQEWKDALYLGELPGTLPRTEAWIRLSASHYYIAIRCAEPTPEKMRTVTLGDEIKGSVWTDDSVEIFIDAQNTGRSLFRLVANSDGTLFDSQLTDLQQVPNGWTSNAEVKARVGADVWEIEIAIPMATMGHHLVHGEVFAINIGRNRFASGARESASYAGNAFVSPNGFRRVVAGGAISGNGFSMISVRRGPFVEKSRGGTWEFEVLSGEVSPSLFEFPNGGSASEGIFQKRYVTFPIAPGQEEAMRECRVVQGGKALFLSSYTVQAQTRIVRVTPTEQPIFEPLMETLPDGLAQHGIINWAHELFQPSMKVLPLRTGMPYAHESTPYENYGRDRTNLITNLNMLRQNPDWMPKSKRYGVNWVIYLQGKQPPEVPVFANPGGKGVAWNLDPRLVEAYMENAREAVQLASEEKNVKWFFAGDEVWERMHVALVRALDEKERYPELQEADREIREKYGFGKYGLPESSDDPNPFRWIATYRWEIDRMLAIASEVKAMIKKEVPDVRFISWDNMTGHRPYAISRWGEVFDVMTAQIYPSQSNGRDHSGFAAKFYTDLGGIEFWPVPHIGHYPASYTSDEVEEILSATFRGGATGLHLWTADYRNEFLNKKGSSVVDRIGAPERWSVVRSIIGRLPFRVRQPRPDTAIFYSNTSYQSTGMPKSFAINNQCEWLYSVLGPKLQSALRFVDDLSVQRDPERLKQLKAVYIPFMPIADDAEYHALESYVKEGGTAVICDPLAFRYRSDGTERQSGALLPPLSSTNIAQGQRIFQRKGASENVLPAKGDRYDLNPKGAKVLTRYEDGKAAVVEFSQGRGRVVFFAGNPLQADLAANPAWVTFFRSLQESFGIKGGHDVWRFRFPATPQQEQERPEGLCLTGNYFEWSRSEPQSKWDARLGGRYTVRGANTSPSEPAGKPVPFGRLSQGRLTDRIAGAVAPIVAKGEDFVLPIHAEEPWSITFEFDTMVSAKTARLFFMGTLPEGHCEISADNKNWSPAAQWNTRIAQGQREVALQQLLLQGDQPVRYVRLNFSPNGAQKCTLVEIDLWGTEQ